MVERIEALRVGRLLEPFGRHVDGHLWDAPSADPQGIRMTATFGAWGGAHCVGEATA